MHSIGPLTAHESEEKQVSNVKRVILSRDRLGGSLRCLEFDLLSPSSLGLGLCFGGGELGLFQASLYGLG